MKSDTQLSILMKINVCLSICLISVLVGCDQLSDTSNDRSDQTLPADTSNDTSVYQPQFTLPAAAAAQPAISTYDPLQIGTFYKLSRKTALMPDRGLTSALSSTKKTKFIEAGSGFKVLEKNKTGGVMWYRAYLYDGLKFHMGWIRSSTLIGQELEIVQ